MKKFTLAAILAFAVFCAGGVVAQEHAAPPAEHAAPQASQPAEMPHEQGASDKIDAQLSEQSHEALKGEHKAEGGHEEGGGHTELKESASVKWIAAKTGMSPSAASLAFFVINFAILFGAIAWFSRSSIPAMLRNRTATIQKGIEEARKASAEATSRLNDIEARLSRLDTEVAAIKASAEADFGAEEARIRQQAEEDARRVVESAEQEISAATRSAQRELKAFAADLAVELAEKKIRVDASTDEALLRGFAAQLGKDGK
ncbi:MAG TPA: ATP synthase F0 subunit B [Clostridia bacterium]|nr:ATP synthase F0 subunit B [Clostridia bacterium]